MNKNNPRLSRRLFHYTTASKLKGLFGEKRIKPATAYVAAGERPAVWFSFRQDFEPTALKCFRDERTGELQSPSFEELTAIETQIRIEVRHSAAPYDWGGFCRLSGCPRKMIKALEIAALNAGADLRDWRASFYDVPIKLWLDAEGYADGKWRALEDLLQTPAVAEFGIKP